MAIEAIRSIKTVIARTLNAKKAEAVATKTAKDGEALMAAGQDASANYNRAMVTAPTYKKPSMEKANIGKTETRAASGGDGFDPGFDPEGGDFPSSNSRAYSDFEREVSGLIDDMGF